MGTFNTTFSSTFCLHLQILDHLFYGLTVKRLRSTAYACVEKHNIPHRFKKVTKIAEREGLHALLKRNFSWIQFYTNLLALMDKYNYPLQSIYNIDETSMSTEQRT